MALAGVPPPYRPVPDAFVGVWQRTRLEAGGAPAEAGWRVLWLQTPHWHGDLRIPANRPDFSGRSRTADCTPEQLAWLAGQKGFAGITEVTRAGDDTFCQWHRQFDFQPPRPHRDLGRIVMTPDGAAMEELGVEADYRETWVRLPQGAGPCAARRRDCHEPAGASEALLIAGDCFFYLRDRPAPLPPGERLALLAHGAAAAGHLDMEISFGQWDRAGGRGVVTHSTLPWREGRTVEGSGWQALS